MYCLFSAAVWPAGAVLGLTEQSKDRALRICIALLPVILKVGVAIDLSRSSLQGHQGVDLLVPEGVEETSIKINKNLKKKNIYIYIIKNKIKLQFAPHNSSIDCRAKRRYRYKANF